MIISETNEFRLIVLESNDYNEAFAEMTSIQALELNRILEEIMTDLIDGEENGIDTYSHAFGVYKEELSIAWGDGEELR